MSLKVAVDMAQSGQIFHGEVAAERQGAVQAGGGVPLGEDEAIPIRPFGVLGVDAQLVEVQVGEQIGRGETAAGVAGFGAVGGSQDTFAYIAGGQLQLSQFLIGHNKLLILLL